MKENYLQLMQEALYSVTQKRQEAAAVTIQAAWRGQMVRRQIKSKQLQEVRERLRRATMTATDTERIGSKTQYAVSYLLKCKDLKRILMAVICLGQYNVICLFTTI